jgi:glycosyltransferase involved in cell wall biosynthesis
LLDRQHNNALQNLLQLLLQLQKSGQPVNPLGIMKQVFPRGIYDITDFASAPCTKKALVIYVDEAIPWLLGGRLEDFPLTGHTMWWESTEMVRRLNANGYAVDWIGLGIQDSLDRSFNWEKYDLIIDGGENNLCKISSPKGPVTALYTTGTHWLKANLAEIGRIAMFQARHGVLLPPERSQRANFSDECADYLTYFGNEAQLQGYNSRCRKIPLNISSVHIPSPRVKDVDKALTHYIWLGGPGMVHKGLDLAVDAFCSMPDVVLHICSFLNTETRFQQWLKSVLKKHPNIVFHGPADVSSPEFMELAWNCIGAVYVSAAEGGPGSVAQLLHYGILPIVTKTSNVRAETLGYVIDSENDREIIQGIQMAVRSILNIPRSLIMSRCEAARRFALEFHTRSAYTRSFEKFLQEIDAARISALAASAS